MPGHLSSEQFRGVVGGPDHPRLGLSPALVVGEGRGFDMPLHPTIRTIARNLPAVARQLGFSARVTSGYRSAKKQAALYQRYLAGLMPYPVAPPGTSDHERGLAIDVVSTNPDELVALLTAAGLFWAGPSDPVHFSMVSPQIASQGQIRQKSFWESFSDSSKAILDIIF